MNEEKQPTVFHVTHWKAGSQWVYGILQACAPTRVVTPKVKVAHFYEDAILPGMIYPTVYAPYNRFDATLHPKGSVKNIGQAPSSEAPSRRTELLQFCGIETTGPDICCYSRFTGRIGFALFQSEGQSSFDLGECC